MRIDQALRLQQAANRPGVNRTGAPEFVLPNTQDPIEARTAAPSQAMTGLDSLLALQAASLVDADPLERRKRVLRRGRSMLDLLDGLKAELLGGKVGAERLQMMMGLLADAEPAEDEGLAATMADIELRVRVELAKLGHFPG